MKLFDLHTHTTYCDGNNSAEEMVLAAVDLGLDAIGFSGHSFTWFDTSYCMSIENTAAYIREVRSLREKYADKIRILLGIEYDYWAETDPEHAEETSPDTFDYVIGSSHYVLKDGKFLDIDYYPWLLMEEVRAHYSGDPLGIATDYFAQVGDIVRRTGCDIIGHFDLITKFIERYALTPDGRIADRWASGGAGSSGGYQYADIKDYREDQLSPLINISDPRYISAWRSAIDSIFEDTSRIRNECSFANRLEKLGLLKAGDKPVFEINTGAMAKGTRTTPYPSQDQIEYIRSKGGILIQSSDSHSTKTLCYGFSR